MSVELISMTQSFVPGVSSPAELIAYTARVSNPGNQKNHTTAKKLLKSLIRDGHWSPLEMVSVTMEVVTTRDIGRQIIRHPSFRFQEFCVSKDTLITTVTNSGRSKKVTIEDLYKRYKSSQYWNMSDRLVRVYDEDTKLLKAACIKEVFYTGTKPVFNLVLDSGKSIKATKEHKFLTKDGYKCLEDISSEDFVAVNGVPVYQDKSWMEEAKLRNIENKKGVAGISEDAGCSYHTIRKWLRVHGLQFSKKEVAEYTTVWNKGLAKELQPRFNVPTSKETRLKQSSSARKGSDSNLFINGNKSHDTISFRQRVAQVSKGSQLTLLIDQNHKCALCNCALDRNNTEVDHILPVYEYPELALLEENLQALCVACHAVKSQEERGFSKQTISWVKVKSIEAAGIEDTYDMEIDHVDHNYVANGIITHNSQRYAIAEGKPVRREARLQDNKNRQNSLRTTDSSVIEAFDMCQAAVETVTQNAYTTALAMGVAKEQARAVLPEGMTSTTMYMHGTLRSWVHYCRLRMGNGTQKEHMDIAEKAWLILRSHFRDICDAVEELEQDKQYMEKIIELLKEDGSYLQLLERVKNNS